MIKIDQFLFWILNIVYLISIPLYYLNGQDVLDSFSNLIFLPFLAYVFKKISALYYRLPFHNNFKKYYLKNRIHLESKSELKKMLDFFIQSESYKYVSYYWNYLNIRSLKKILNSQLNLNDYATSLGLYYYIFTDVTDEEVSQAMKNIANENFNIDVNIYKKHKNFDYTQSLKYNNLLFLLYLNLKKKDYFVQLTKLNDSGYLCFNDPYLEIDGIKVTTDKINSLFDYEKITKFTDFKNLKTILEIGAGSGRTSQAILDLNQNIKYIICDIPTALYVSYNRLSKAFPDKKIGLLYDYNFNKKNYYTKNKDSYFGSTLISEINKYDISFILPHQLSYITEKYFDLTIAIDCIHEMDKKIIRNYFDNINNISNLFYFSVWKKTIVPFSGFFNFNRNKLNYHLDDYGIPKNWKKTFEEDLIFPANFISSGYKIL